MKRLLEICCTSVACARVAQDEGADRIELCVELDAGGLTPPDALLDAVVDAVRIPVYVLIRPRPGDFVFDADTISTMVADVVRTLARGAEGIVTGALHPDSTVDAGATRTLFAPAVEAGTTFHRAFDLCPDPGAALDALRGLGVDSVLTAATRMAGADASARFRALAARADGMPALLCAGGLRAHTIEPLAAMRELYRFHSAARRDGPGVDAREVRALRTALDAVR